MEQKTASLFLTDKSLLISFTLTSFLSFVIPFSFGHPQFLVGSLVNSFLFLAAMFFPTRFSYSLIFFPSLAVLSRGIIFGPLTPWLIYMIPFIWMSNWILVFSFRNLISNNNQWISAGIASILKSTFLFSSALLLFKLRVIPRLFLSVMSFNQLITALSGFLLAWLTKKILIKKY